MDKLEEAARKIRKIVDEGGAPHSAEWLPAIARATMFTAHHRSGSLVPTRD